MAKESSKLEDGIANFGFNPEDKSGQQDLFSSIHSPINDLANELLEAFAGQTITSRDVFYKHNLGKNFVWKNYQDALRKLEEESRIQTSPNSEERRRVGDMVTFGENVSISFPKK